MEERDLIRCAAWITRCENVPKCRGWERVRVKAEDEKPGIKPWCLNPLDLQEGKKTAPRGEETEGACLGETRSREKGITASSVEEMPFPRRLPDSRASACRGDKIRGTHPGLCQERNLAA